MRVLIAALLGGLVVFLWGFVSHVVLPVGDMGMRQPANEDVVLEAIKTGLGAEGVYYLPSIAPDKMDDEAASKAWAEKSKASPYVFIVHRSGGYDPSAMGPNLATEFMTTSDTPRVTSVQPETDPNLPNPQHDGNGVPGVQCGYGGCGSTGG